MIHVRSHITLIDDPTDGNAGRICGVITDISRRKAAEEALERSTEALRRSNNELQQFAYVASHDLQEPLRMVSSYLQLIEKRYKDQLDEDGCEFIHFAVDGANRMKALINDLLTFSRVETNPQQPEAIDFKKLLNTVTNDLAVSIVETGAVIEYDNLPEVIADKRQMTQLLQNLISNAIKFRNETRPPYIRIEANTMKGYWQFAIADNGIGIEPRYKERIFQIFQRLHGIGQYEGTGIGLAICKKVVERHGGQIWLESEPDVGTTFHFTLPMKQQTYEERVVTNAIN